MKFKKTSVIGVVLSLALVLAVTVAFASEPKTPADTVVYHGQTYNRADLSRETLDWLDWYLALPEEQQLAVSMVPPELIPGLTPDDYDSVAVNASVTAGGNTLTDAAAKYVSQFHADMTRDEVHQLLGEPHNFLSGLYGDTYLLERLQGLPVTEPTTEAPLLIIYYDNGDFNGGVSKVERVVCRTGDGEHIVLLQSTPEYQPNDVLPDENAYDNYNGVKAGEDASSVASGGGTAGRTYYPLCLDPDCGVTDSHAHINGQVVKVDYQDPYTGSTQPPSAIPGPIASCGVSGCTIQGEHTHHSESHGSDHHGNGHH